MEISLESGKSLGPSKNGLHGSFLKWTLYDYVVHREECETVLDKLEDWSTVPAINVVPMNNIVEGTLVTYTGMVQDMLNPEYFSTRIRPTVNDGANAFVTKSDTQSAHNHWITGNEELLPVEESDENCGSEHLEERRPVFCIPIPGLNSWAKKSPPITSNDNLNQQPSQVAKRRLSIDDNEMEVDSNPCKSRPSASSESASVTEKIFTNDCYLPFPETDLPCLVKMPITCEILLNDRIEVLGFVSFNAILSGESTDPENKAYQPPPTLVPRIHAVRVKKMRHCNPFLPQTIPSAESWSEDDEVRNNMHMALTQILFGDTLAADYLICSLLASIYIRSDSLTLGAFSLNLYNIRHPGYAKRLFDFLQQLVPTSVYLPLTIDSLNNVPFIPKKDYEANRLCSGRLQLSDDTHLLVDETEMQEGRLNDLGCRNIAALRSLVLRQQVQYDFKYYRIDYNTSIPVVVISEGKSMIPVDISLKVEPEGNALSKIEEVFDAAAYFLSGPRLDKVRNFLSNVKLFEFSMDDDISSRIEHDWVEMRQKNPKLMQEDLHRHIVLARLLSLSLGKLTLSQSTWAKVREMEEARLFRIN